MSRPEDETPTEDVSTIGPPTFSTVGARRAYEAGLFEDELMTNFPWPAWAYDQTPDGF